MLMLSLMAGAHVTTEVTTFLLSGPMAVSTPFGVDSVDVQGKKFDEKSILDGLSLMAPATTTFSGQVLPSLEDSKSVGVLSFYVNNTRFIKGKLNVQGPKNHKLFIDGAEAQPDIKLSPEHHTIAIKYIADAKSQDSIRVTIEADSTVAYTTDEHHPFMFHDMTDGRRVRNVSLSSDGTYIIVTYQNTERGGNSQWSRELRDVKSGRLLYILSRDARWMPRSVAYIEEEWDAGHKHLIKVDPKTGERSRFATDVPNGGYTISPTEDYLIITADEEGPKEDNQVYEVVEMSDRQSGWRRRTYLMRYDIATDLSQRITFGNKGEYLYDISPDGKKLLIGSSHSRLTKRPTTVHDIYIMDAKTLAVDTLITAGEFFDHAGFSPDGKQLLFRGNPEAFNRIGCQLPADVTPSSAEYELFLFDIATK